MSGEMLTLAYAEHGDLDNGNVPFWDIWSDGDEHSGLKWVDGITGVTDLETACERLGIDRSTLVEIAEWPSPPYTSAWRFPAEALA